MEGDIGLERAAERGGQRGRVEQGLAAPAGTVIDVVEFIPPDPVWLAEHGTG